MESLAVLSLLKLLDGGYGDSSLHPSLTYQSMVTPQERRDELYGEVDRPFQHLPGYQSAIVMPSQGDFPLGVFERPIAVDDKIGDGILSNYLQSAIRDFVENLEAKGKSWYAENITPLDPTLIILSIQGYNLANEKRKLILGQFNIQQGDFFGRLNAQNYRGALLQAFDLASLGFDRLRGYMIRTEALRTAPVISMADKIQVQSAMDADLKRSESELKFWITRTLELLKLTDLLHYLDDINETLIYQDETGGPNQGFKNDLERYKIESLKLELQAAFYNKSRRERLSVNFIFRTFEYMANSLSPYFAQGVGAKHPRDFLKVAEDASARIAQEYKDLGDYKEVKALPEIDRAVKYLEAIARGRFLLAKQILVNWHCVPNKIFLSEQELKKLDMYKKFLEQLRWLQTQLLVLEYHVAVKLKEKRDEELENYAEKIRQAIATINCDHRELTTSFLMDVQSSIKALQPNVAQLKTTFTDMLRRILLRGNLVESTSSFYVVTKKVTQKNQEYCEITKQVHGLLWGGAPVPYNADDIDSPQDDEGEGLPNAALLNPVKVDVFNGWALHDYKQFESPQRYLAFVEDPQFESLISIGIAVFFSDQDLEEQIPNWSWSQQKKDLTEYYELSRRVEQLASRLSHSSQDFINSLKLQLLESLRKQVRTDYSTYKLNKSTSWFDLESYKNSAVLFGRSAARKYFRMSQGKYPLNNDIPNFRDPKFQADIKAQLEMEILPAPGKAQENDSDE